MLSLFAGNVALILTNSHQMIYQDPGEPDLPKLTICWSTRFSFDKALGARPTDFVLSDDICLPHLVGD